MNPPIYNFRDLGQEAQLMAKNCGNERMAMTLQCVAIGSMIIMAGATAAHLLKALFGHTGQQDRSR